MSLAAETLSTEALRGELGWALAQARAPVVRPIEQWVEDELILPNGPFQDERYRHHRHPISRIWFRAIDSGLWSRFAATGPTQNGKTLMCYVAPTLYHLFEIGETVIVGLPSMDMANDKWTQDFLPVIEASDYRDLLPLRGEGSRGGQVKRSITFQNGATLRFMTGGGSDKKRAGYTARVVAVTETDGMDESGEASREADKIEQIEGRTRAYGRTGKRIYLECTVSIEAGRIWQEITRGTDSKIMRPCLHCRVFVCPERENLVGWETAESEEDAAAKAFWSCPACGEAWSEAERFAAVEKAVLVHRGQEVTTEGEVIGDPPATQTLGFRWSAIDNPFVTAGDLGAEEWTAKRSRDQENAEKKMRQFVWTVPYEPPDVDLTPLDPAEIIERKSGMKKGLFPEDTIGIAIGVDTGKRALHWHVEAVGEDGKSLRVIDYGIQTVEANRLGVHRGLVEALRQLSGYFSRGWSSPSGRQMGPSQVWIDSGYHEHTDAVYAFCEEMNKGRPFGQEIYRPTKGYGEGQRIGRYLTPRGKSADIVYMGKEYYISVVRRRNVILPGVLLVHINSDHWKSEFHQRLLMPQDAEGAITLFDTADPFEHAELTNHYVAERQKEKFIPGRGTVVIWERSNRNNHYLDAGYSSTTAADFIVRLAEIPVAEKRAAVISSGSGIQQRQARW